MTRRSFFQSLAVLVVGGALPKMPAPSPTLPEPQTMTNAVTTHMALLEMRVPLPGIRYVNADANTAHIIFTDATAWQAHPDYMARNDAANAEDAFRRNLHAHMTSGAAANWLHAQDRNAVANAFLADADATHLLMTDDLPIIEPDPDRLGYWRLVTHT